MLSSMTGFGRAVLDASFGRLTVEIYSVNRKYLEIFLSTPKEFGRFEPEIRKWVADSLARGQVSVRVYLEPTLGSIEESLPDVQLLKALKKNWDKIAKEVGVDAASIDLPFLLEYLPTKAKEMSDENAKALRSCVEEALKALVVMKLLEGQAMASDLASRLGELEKMIGEIEKHTPDATSKMRTKLFEKMEEVMKMGPEMEERLLREVALFAERVDVSEEITRFHSHISQFQGLLKQAAIGRKMEFLLQEMGREVNTIGSKSMDIHISHTVVAMKAELEKMREQVQNIE